MTGQDGFYVGADRLLLGAQMADPTLFWVGDPVKEEAGEGGVAVLQDVSLMSVFMFKGPYFNMGGVW